MPGQRAGPGRAWGSSGNRDISSGLIPQRGPPMAGAKTRQPSPVSTPWRRQSEAGFLWSPLRRRLRAADSFDSTNLIPGISASGGIVFPAPIPEKVWIEWFSTRTFGPLLEVIPPRRWSTIDGRDPIVCHHGVHGGLDQSEFSGIGFCLTLTEESSVSRDGHRRQSGEDTDHDQQLNQGKAPLAPGGVSCQKSHKNNFPAEYLQLRL